MAKPEPSNGAFTWFWGQNHQKEPLKHAAAMKSCRIIFWDDQYCLFMAAACLVFSTLTLFQDMFDKKLIGLIKILHVR
jgi:hypothetical protein